MKFKNIGSWLSGIIFFVTLFALSCKKELTPKEEEVSQSNRNSKFFTANLPSDKKVEAIRQFIIRQDDKYQFSQKYQDKVGIPRWDKAITFGSNKVNNTDQREENAMADSSITWIPITNDNDSTVNTALGIKIKSSDTTYKVVFGKQYADYGFGSAGAGNWNAFNVFHLFALLDKSVFNRTTFNIIDSNLATDPIKIQMASQGIHFSDVDLTYKVGSEVSTSLSFTICNPASYCVKWKRGFKPSQGSVEENTDPTDACEIYGYTSFCTIIFIPESPSGGGSGGSGGTGGTGGGGTGGGGIGDPTEPCPQNPDGTPVRGCGLGWQPVPYSPSIIFLGIELNLDETKKSWLDQHPGRAEELVYYLQTTTTDDDLAKTLAIQHIEKMMADSEYLDFVEDHSQNGQNNQIWWEDVDWLRNPINFNLSIENNAQPLTAAEIALAIIFPLHVYQINANISTAFSMSDVKFGPWTPATPHLGTNDKKDAFRHAFFNAINTRNAASIPFHPSGLSGPVIIKLFADAHESEVPTALAMEKTMDLYNNEVGISYCINCATSTTNADIANAIMNKLYAGLLKYLAPLDWTASPDYPAGKNGITDTTEIKWTNQ